MTETWIIKIKDKGFPSFTRDIDRVVEYIKTLEDLEILDMRIDSKRLNNQ